jgi:hypothetical protein
MPMLTDDELSTRLSAAFRDAAPELSYTGPVPHVRRGGSGLVATSGLAVAAALVLLPSALKDDTEPAPQNRPSANPGQYHTSPYRAGPKEVRTIDIAGLRLTSASVDGDPGPLYFVGGNHLKIPADAKKVDVGLPVDVFFADHSANGDPQVYLSYQVCPDTTEGCNGAAPTTTVVGLSAPGWTKQQLMELLEHPVEAQDLHD